MGNKLYVGNLPFSTTSETLRELFASHGEIASCDVISDRDTGRSRGFGFVEFQNESDAQDAMGALDGADVDGRNLRVNEAQDKRSGGGSRDFRG